MTRPAPMVRRRWIFAAVLLALLLVFPIARITLRLASSAHGLTVVALLGPDEWTFNPFSNKAVVLPPNAARWLLLHTDFPYGPCEADAEGCEVSLVAWAGRSLGNASPQGRERAMELMRHFIERGESMNRLSQGLTPLHEAVLYRDAQYLEFLLGAGADDCARADQRAKSAAGLTPLEFCLRLEEKRPGQQVSLCQRLTSVRNGSRQAPGEPHCPPAGLARATRQSAGE
jgi:hypothetical protein